MIALRNTKKQRVGLAMREEVLEDFRGFVKWAQGYQPHADAETVLEHILSESLGGRTAEMLGFREWKKRREEGSNRPVEPALAESKAAAHERARELLRAKAVQSV